MGISTPAVAVRRASLPEPLCQPLVPLRVCRGKGRRAVTLAGRDGDARRLTGNVVF